MARRMSSHLCKEMSHVQLNFNVKICLGVVWLVVICVLTTRTCMQLQYPHRAIGGGQKSRHVWIKVLYTLNKCNWIVYCANMHCTCGVLPLHSWNAVEPHPPISRWQPMVSSCIGALIFEGSSTSSMWRWLWARLYPSWSTWLTKIQMSSKWLKLGNFTPVCSQFHNVRAYVPVTH